LEIGPFWLDDYCRRDNSTRILDIVPVLCNSAPLHFYAAIVDDYHAFAYCGSSLSGLMNAEVVTILAMLLVPIHTVFIVNM